MQHRVLRLVRDQLHAELLRERVALLQLLRRPLRDADVERLALTDDVGERLERLLQRGLVVEAVRLVEVDVVGAEARQRAVDRLEDVLAAQSGVVRALGTCGEVDLREDLESFAALPFERLAEHDLRRRVGIRVCRVERGDAGVERRVHRLDGGVVFDLRSVRDPVAIGDLRDLETAVAEIAIVDHATTLPAPADTGPGSS